MKKPTFRGLSPARKAHLALRDKLNRKSKLPPPLEIKKSAARFQRIIQNEARHANE